jgi:hypothetical protein
MSKKLMCRINKKGGGCRKVSGLGGGDRPTIPASAIHIRKKIQKISLKSDIRKKIQKISLKSGIGKKIIEKSLRKEDGIEARDKKVAIKKLDEFVRMMKDLEDQLKRLREKWVNEL